MCTVSYHPGSREGLYPTLLYYAIVALHVSVACDPIHKYGQSYGPHKYVAFILGQFGGDWRGGWRVVVSQKSTHYVGVFN